MAADEYQLDRMRSVLKESKTAWDEKRMFGGTCFMVDDKMCFGTFQGGMMVRVDPEEIDDLIKRDATEQMINGGRPMKGFLLVSPEGYDMEDDLEFWINKCLAFNPFAKSSKKKK
jgi:hypothetical protein